MATKKIADIRKFTGFITPDGSTHDTLKKATDHTKELKIKAALADFALVTQETNPGVTENALGSSIIFVSNLPAFLLAHREDILAAFNQDVTLRAPRTKKTPIAALVTPMPIEIVNAV